MLGEKECAAILMRFDGGCIRAEALRLLDVNRTRNWNDRLTLLGGFCDEDEITIRCFRRQCSSGGKSGMGGTSGQSTEEMQASSVSSGLIEDPVQENLILLGRTRRI